MTSHRAIGLVRIRFLVSSVHGIRAFDFAAIDGLVSFVRRRRLFGTFSNTVASTLTRNVGHVRRQEVVLRDCIELVSLIVVT